MSIEERANDLIGSLDRQVHRQITKPVYMVGETVYAPYTQNGGNEWYPGHITQAIKQDQTTEWGSTWKYNITFDDGDKESGIEEEFVFKTEEYLLLMSGYMEKQHAIKNVVDKTSNDGWARDMGCYEVTIGGRKSMFSSLKEAKKAIEDSNGE